MKRKLLLLTISLLLLSMIFVACAGDREITSLEVNGLKFTLALNETPDYSGVTAVVTYNNNPEDTENLTADQLTFSEIDTSTAGNKTLTVTYDGFSVDYTIKVEADVAGDDDVVEEPEVLDSIKIAFAEGFNGKIEIGETVTASQLVVSATYKKGESTVTRTVTEGVTLGTIDTATAGKKTLTVTYEDKTATIEITVKEAPAPLSVTGFSIAAGTVNTVINEGETVDTTGLKVNVEYSDGSTKELEADDVTISVDLVAKKLTVTWTDEFGVTQTAIQDIIVVAAGDPEPPVTTPQITGITLVTYQTETYVDVAYNTVGTKIKATYDNGSVAYLTAPVEGVTVTYANGTVTVAYAGFTATGTVEVIGINEITIEAATVNGNVHTVELGTTLQLDETTVRVTYNDFSTRVVGKAEGLSVTATTTTDPQVRKATVTASYYGKTATLEIKIKVATYSVTGATLDTGIASFKANANEFTITTEPYRVGDDNNFVFTQTIQVWDKVTASPGTDMTRYPALITVSIVEGGAKRLLSGDELDAYVKIDNINHTFDFTDAAVGKTFYLTTCPFVAQDAKYTASLTVTVVDAYNVYEAWELNLMTNANSRDIAQYGQTNKTQVQLVDEFLATKGATRPAKLAGFVLHNTLTVKKSDVPQGYFYTYMATQGTQYAGNQVEHLYDHFSIFGRTLSASNPNFTFYGNYNTLYTYNLPIVAEPGHAGNTVDDPNSSSELFAFITEHNAYNYANDYTRYESNTYNANYNFNNLHARVENIRLFGDDPYDTDASNSEKHKRSLIAIKNFQNVLDMYNVKTQAYMLTLVADGDNQLVNIDKCRFYDGWQNHLYVYNINHIYSNVNDQPYANHQPIVINITDSTLTKCGGPVIISDFGSVGETRNSKSGGTVNVNAHSTLWSYVLGTETWFEVNKVAPLATQLLGAGDLLAYHASVAGCTAKVKSYVKNDVFDGDFANIIFVNRGPRGSFNYTGHGKGLNMQDADIQSYLASPYTGYGMAPTFQSWAGGIATTDGQSQIYTKEMGAPSTTLYQGEYLNIIINAAGHVSSGDTVMGVVVAYAH